MLSRNVVLGNLEDYKALARAFGTFCERCDLAFPADTNYGLSFSPRTGNSREFTVLEHPCRVRFTIGRTAERFMIGRLFFDRVISPRRTQRLLTLHFDESLSAVTPGAPSGRGFSLREPPDLQQHMAVSLLQAMLDSLSAESDTESTEA